MSQVRNLLGVKSSPLEQAVLRWCRSVHPLGLGRANRVAELYDHVMCEVEERTAQGMSAEPAFLEAIEQMGDAGALSAEYAKLRGLQRWSVIFAAFATGNSRALDLYSSSWEQMLVLFSGGYFLSLSILLVIGWIPVVEVALVVAFGLVGWSFVGLKAFLLTEGIRTVQISEKILRGR